MKKNWMNLLLVFLLVLPLAGCGSGGGGGGGEINNHAVSTDNAGGWPIVTLSPNDTINGTLQSTDIHLPDGSYADGYQITLDSATTLTIRLESGAFDAYLFLYEGAALDEADLNNWDTYWIYENDDLDGTTYNAEISVPLPAGTYVIVANSFDAAETGSYTLTTSTPEQTSNSNISVNLRYVQFRSYENSIQNHYAAWIEFKNGDQDIAESDIQSISLLNPDGAELTPAAAPTFMTTPFVYSIWNPITSQFENTYESSSAGFYFDLSNYNTLGSGTYTFQAQTSGGQITNQVDFPGGVVSPVVNSTTMSYQWQLDSSLTLSWSEPLDSYDQLRVYFADSDGNGIFHGTAVPGTTQVTLSANLVQQITSIAGTPTPTSLNWQMQTRSYQDVGNYSRGYSDAVSIPWPAP